MARLYSNENFPLPVVEKLRAERIHQALSEPTSLSGQPIRVNRPS